MSETKNASVRRTEAFLYVYTVDLTVFAGEQLVGLQILGNGLVNHVLRQVVVAVGVGLEPVAHELLIEGRLAVARLVAFQRPEAGGIRGEHFVAQHHVAVLIQTKLKLGVGNDDAAGERIFSTLLIQGNGVVAQLGGVLLAVAGELLFQHLDALFVGDVLVVVADLGLGGGSVDRLGQLVGLLQALGQLDAAHLAGLLVAGPAAAGDVAAHDALNGQHGQLTAHHAVAVELGLLEELRHILHVHAQHMVGQQIAGVIEPELAHLGQNGALLVTLFSG